MKISGVLTKTGKYDIVLMYVSIARLIPIIKLTLVSYEKRERKKQVCCILLFCENCKYVTICSVFVLYEIKMENLSKKMFFCQIGIFCLELGKKTYFFGIGNGAEFRPQNRVIESPGLQYKNNF